MDLLECMDNLHINPKESEIFKSIGAEIEGVHTEFLVAHYTNKTLLLATQYGKCGSLVTVEKEEVYGPEGRDIVFNTKLVFGTQSDEHMVTARYLAENLNIKNTLHCFMTLKSYDIETVKAVKDVFATVLNA